MKKILATFFLATFILCSLVACNEKEIVIDAKSLASIEAEGLSAKGRVFATPDKEIIDSVVKGYEPEIKSQQRYNDFLLAIHSIKYKISPTPENLSNNDSLSIVAVYDEDLIKKAKIKIENTEFTYIVSGLAEPVMIDPFAEIELVYDGISPDARVDVYNRSEKQFVRDIKYVVEPSNKLRIGDKIVVTAKLDVEKAEAQGLLVPDTLTKEFTVENIDEYVKDFNDIDQATKDKMKKESLDRVVSECANARGSIMGFNALNLWSASEDKIKNTTFDEPELLNVYFNTLKEGSKSGSKNDVFYVYKVTAHYAPEPEPRIAYAAVRFSNVVKKTDGSIDFSNFDTSLLFYSSTGFEHVYREVVTAQRASYEIQEITL